MNALICSGARPQMKGLPMSRHNIFERLDARRLLLDQVNELMTEASRMPPGVERDRVLEHARAAQVEANAERLPNSSGLQPPSCDADPSHFCGAIT